MHQQENASTTQFSLMPPATASLGESWKAQTQKVRQCRILMPKPTHRTASLLDLFLTSASRKAVNKTPTAKLVRLTVTWTSSPNARAPASRSQPSKHNQPK